MDVGYLVSHAKITALVAPFLYKHPDYNEVNLQHENDNLRRLSKFCGSTAFYKEYFNIFPF